MIHNETGYEPAKDTLAIPDQVMVVYAHLLECAVRAEKQWTTDESEPDDPYYMAYRRVYLNPPSPSHTDEWVIGDNFEQLSFSLLFDQSLGQWINRSHFDGADRLISFQEAKQTAAIAYTG